MINKKQDKGKLRFSLLPTKTLLEVLQVLEFGAKKYGEENWRHTVDGSTTRYIDAAVRHILAFNGGEELDTESGNNHLAHAITSLFFAMELSLISKEPQEKPTEKITKDLDNPETVTKKDQPISTGMWEDVPLIDHFSVWGANKEREVTRRSLVSTHKDVPKDRLNVDLSEHNAILLLVTLLKYHLTHEFVVFHSGSFKNRTETFIPTCSCTGEVLIYYFSLFSTYAERDSSWCLSSCPKLFKGRNSRVFKFALPDDFSHKNRFITFRYTEDNKFSFFHFSDSLVDYLLSQSIVVKNPPHPANIEQDPPLVLVNRSSDTFAFYTQ